MPIVENDPWRQQYFAGVGCPDDVTIPTDDALAYLLYPARHWIYNKLLICETQGLAHAPHGIPPSKFPVFSKPIYNLRGMGAGGKVLASLAEYERAQTPGHMWMQLLVGEHVSTDAAIVEGEPRWWRHTLGKTLGKGMFDYWTVLAEPRPEIEAYCGTWVRDHLRDYSGAVNFETIGGKIIEAHLRFTDQWPDLYGLGWIESIVELYAHNRWCFADEHRRTGYSVVLFGEHGRRYQKVDQSTVADLLTRPAISSLQITFHADKPPAAHAMPPGGFRLAIVNCWDLAAGFAVREKLMQLFASQPIASV
jgi:hypothetical protein